jgi:glutaminyl-tRNA synthetase
MGDSTELSWLGITPERINEIQRNKKLSEVLTKISKLAKSLNCPSNEKAEQPYKGLLYALASKIKPQINDHLPLLVKYIVEDKLRQESQLNSALAYLLKHVGESLNEKEMNEYCGVGIVVTYEEIDDVIKEVLEKHRNEIMEQSFSKNRLLGEVTTDPRLKWATGSVVRSLFEARLIHLTGVKSIEELKPGKKAVVLTEKKEKAVKAEAPKSKKTVDTLNGGEAITDTDSIEELLRTRTHFHKVGENYTTEGYVMHPWTKDLLKKHVENVQGKVHTRFPPEPNGVLHVGHAKAVNINFCYAKVNGGNCYLRFDDTNPEKEEEKFFTAIEDVVRWLKYNPYKVTHSSDYFQQLYLWAIQLIEDGLAYVCHQKVEEMRGFNVEASPWRDRPIKENLELFESMRLGLFDEGEATLRLKHILEEGKVDPVAYRVKYVPHHRTGNDWCIYPTYDYTHCLCDSIENITHSLCTKEFQSRRSSYYWLCNALKIYCPVQWEYSRLNVYYSVISKRKILKLIQNRVVRDYDDPRLFTLTGLRRRGIPAEAINNFVAKLGLTVAQTAVDPIMLDAFVRDYLNAHSPRTMAVLEPLKLIIQNFDELNLPLTVKVPDFPTDPARAAEEHTVAFDGIIYIEQSDFRLAGEKGFRRMSPEQYVGLKYIGLVLKFITATEDEKGNILEIVVRGEPLTTENKPKAFIHWVAKPLFAEVRLYERLFMHKNPEDPEEVPGGFLTDCNSNSLTVIYKCAVDKYLSNSPTFSSFQFERTGYFSVDPDSSDKKLVFNRTVLLKEDSGK